MKSRIRLPSILIIWAVVLAAGIPVIAAAQQPQLEKVVFHVS
jgi:hypothetical protein